VTDRHALTPDGRKAILRKWQDLLVKDWEVLAQYEGILRHQRTTVPAEMTGALHHLEKAIDTLGGNGWRKTYKGRFW
jgi:acyl-CoA reductase-like NAD-dependent aldehyde dehydrogenase